jgi:Integral membrane protein CcmA involved in cell shape determination
MAEIEKINLADMDEEDYDTVLAADIYFNGRIACKKPFMIKGSIEGSIASTSDITIEECSDVKANIRADRVIIKGSVEGNVSADTMVHVFSCGKLIGDVTAPEVILESGCVFNGICTMKKDVQNEK